MYQTFGPAEPEDGGSVEDCDFEDAVLHCCEFFCDNLPAQRLPPWPVFAVPSPAATAAALERSGKWPSRARDELLGMKLARQPNWLVMNAEVLAQNQSTGVDIASLRAALDAVRGVIIIDAKARSRGKSADSRRMTKNGRKR